MYESVEEVKENVYVKKKEYVKPDGSISYKHIVVYPIIKTVPGNLAWNNLHWKNLLTGGSWMNLVIIACLLISAWAYQHDTAECYELVNNPCDYVDEFGCQGKVYEGEYGELKGNDWVQFVPESLDTI